MKKRKNALKKTDLAVDKQKQKIFVGTKNVLTC